MPRLVRYNPNEVDEGSSFSATGIIGGVEYEVGEWKSCQWAVEGVGAGTVVEVEAKIFGQTNWVMIDTFTGPTDKVTTDIAAVDKIRFNCTTYDTGPGNLYASVFVY